MAPTPDRRWTGALALGLALAFAGPAAAEPGTVLKPTELRAQPLGSAEVLAQLAAQDAVEITARQGAWAGVTTAAGQQGWVRVLNLRTASGAVNRGGDGSLAQAFRTGSTSNDVSTGVKGLGAEDLRNASPDEAEAAKLAGFAATPDDARAFAGEASLQPQEVDYLAAERGGRRRQR